jgi:predicted transcriptional regulator of viral defense system
VALQNALTATYNLLDPLLPREGKYLSRWKLRLNVTREEIETIRTT